METQLALLDSSEIEAVHVVHTVHTKLETDINIIELLLQDKRSERTRRAYDADLAQFFANQPFTVRGFLAWPPPKIALRLAQFKGEMRIAKLSEATINRRLAAVRSLLKFAYRLGFSTTDGRSLVDGEKVVAYRDTAGITLAQMQRLVEQPALLHGAATLRARRDAVILILLCENALRRAEVAALDVGDFSFSRRKLMVLGKGKGSQKAPVTLSETAANAIAEYVITGGHINDKGPLLRNLHHDPGREGARITGNGLYWLIAEYGRALGLERLTPHMLRHSCITAALDATAGDVRKVQRLSRHADLRTISIYDDNRADFQGEVTGLLSGMIHKNAKPKAKMRPSPRVG